MVLNKYEEWELEVCNFTKEDFQLKSHVNLWPFDKFFKN